MFISPMLASSPHKKKPLTFAPGEWIAQEKFDGHRLIVQVEGGMTSLFVDKKVQAWSRHGLRRILPTHLLEDLSKFPDITMDGELFVPGQRSYGVTELVNGPDLTFYAFDLLAIRGENVIEAPFYRREELLHRVFATIGFATDFAENSVRLAPTYSVNNQHEVNALRDQMWAAGKEGLILKRTNNIYVPGKRSKDWIKIKDLQSAVLRVIGFEASRGTINDRGPFAMVLLEDEDGNQTAVKTRTDADCRKFEEEHRAGKSSIGRALRIEFQERTPDGNYRHPRWDRWENE